MMTALLPMLASADDSGNCGYRLYNDDPNNPYAMSDNVKWSYVESTHTLTISGTGEMMDFGPWVEDDPTSFVTTPWDSFKENIQKLIVQSGVTTVDGFINCSNLTSVTLPSTIVSISPYAFCGCAFSSFTIPNSVKNIGFGAFSECKNLTSITIPKGVTGIGRYLFSGCSSLGSINVESGNTKYDSRNGCNAIIYHYFYENGDENIVLWAGCKNTVIPDGVKEIESFAFAGHTGLTSLKIPQSVTSIGYEIFNRCSNLSSVFCYCSDVPYVGGMYFGNTMYATLGSVENATLYVYSNLIDKFGSNWEGFKAVMPIENASDPKCATPTIKVDNGVLRFECATEGVEFHYNVQLSSEYETPYSGTYDKTNDSGINGVVLPYATISVYASKSGYSLSDTATLTVKLSSGKLGDLNGDGVVNVADHVELSNIILEQNNK